MATFTIKLSDLIQEEFDFGLNDYPIFDEDYREALNKKILDHYWNYEIGQETESMFRFSLNRKMNEIMPIYNQFYKSTQVEFDPLQTINIVDFTNNVNTNSGTVENSSTTNGNTTESSIGTTNSDTTGKSRSVSSTTPQVQLSGHDDYASNAADVNSITGVVGESENSGSTNSAVNSTLDSAHNDTSSGTIDKSIKGTQGSAAELLMKYRSTFLNIDMEVIRELESLFMQIWDNGDEFNNNKSIMNWGFGYGFGLL